MDNRIAIGDKVDLEKIDNRIASDPEKRKVFTTQVLDESEAGEILAAMPIHEGKIVPLNIGQVFSATFYTKSGLQSCDLEVTKRYKKGTLFLVELTQITKLSKKQRREFFRLSCRMPIEYRVIDAEEKEMIIRGESYDHEDKETEWKNGIMLDLSGGGIWFVSTVHEEKTAFIQVRFEIEKNERVEVIYAFATLLRSEQNPNNKAIYDDHVMFWELNDDVRENIIRFIFEEQRRMRSKEMGMDK